MKHTNLSELLSAKFEKNYIFDEGYHFDIPTIALCRKYSCAQITSLIYINAQSNYKRYSCDVICGNCDNKFCVKSLSRSKLLEYMFPKREKKYDNRTREIYFVEKVFLCTKCIQEKKQQEKIANQRIQQQCEDALPANTDNFIHLYLNPNMRWTDYKDSGHRIQEMQRKNVCWDNVELAAIRMNYADFLQTPYWKMIAYHVKKRAKFRCKLCDCSENLVAHHATYTVRGRELQNMDKLVCICHNCHENFHGVENESY